jgi:hypothetical protein
MKEQRPGMRFLSPKLSRTGHDSPAPAAHSQLNSRLGHLERRSNSKGEKSRLPRALSPNAESNADADSSHKSTHETIDYLKALQSRLDLNMSIFLDVTNEGLKAVPSKIGQIESFLRNSTIEGVLRNTVGFIDFYTTQAKENLAKNRMILMKMKTVLDGPSFTQSSLPFSPKNSVPFFESQFKDQELTPNELLPPKPTKVLLSSGVSTGSIKRHKTPVNQGKQPSIIKEATGPNLNSIIANFKANLANTNVLNSGNQIIKLAKKEKERSRQRTDFSEVRQKLMTFTQDQLFKISSINTNVDTVESKVGNLLDKLEEVRLAFRASKINNINISQSLSERECKFCIKHQIEIDELKAAVQMKNSNEVQLISEIEIQRNRLENEIRDLKDSKSALYKQTGVEIASTNAKLATLQEKYKAAKEETKHLITEISQIRSQKSQTLLEMESNVQAKTKEVATLQQKVKELEDELTKKESNAELESFKIKNIQIQEKPVSTRETSPRLNPEIIEQLSNAHMEAEQVLQKEINTLKQEVTSFEAKVESLSMDLSLTKAELSSKTSILAQAMKTISTHESTLEDLRSIIDKNNTSIQQFISEVQGYLPEEVPKGSLTTIQPMISSRLSEYKTACELLNQIQRELNDHLDPSPQKKNREVLGSVASLVKSINNNNNSSPRAQSVSPFWASFKLKAIGDDNKSIGSPGDKMVRARRPACEFISENVDNLLQESPVEKDIPDLWPMRRTVSQGTNIFKDSIAILYQNVMSRMDGINGPLVDSLNKVQQRMLLSLGSTVPKSIYKDTKAKLLKTLQQLQSLQNAHPANLDEDKGTTMQFVTEEVKRKVRETLYCIECNFSRKIFSLEDKLSKVVEQLALVSKANKRRNRIEAVKTQKHANYQLGPASILTPFLQRIKSLLEALSFVDESTLEDLYCRFERSVLDYELPDE